MEDETSSLIDLKGASYLNKEPLQPDFPPSKALSFLEQIGMKKEVEKFSLLTRRELQCLHLLGQGYSAKESGLQLNLSPRTVESYLENIKNKLGCFNKKDLIFFSQILP